jgi:hypothetical protein
MTWQRKIVLSTLIGPLLSIIGVALIAIGGWGPCGPHSTVAAIGGCFCVEHIRWWASVIPDFEATLAKLVPDAIALVLVPSIDFTAIAFLVLAVGSHFGKPKQKEA